MKVKPLVERQEMLEMARIGWIPAADTKSVEIYVRTDDGGNIPHFHVRKYGDNNTFEWETCVRYDKPEYFLHGEYKDKLPRKYNKLLDSVLRQKNRKNPNRTYWETAIDAWNDNNSNIELPFDLEQPDYSLL